MWMCQLCFGRLVEISVSVGSLTHEVIGVSSRASHLFTRALLVFFRLFLAVRCTRVSPCGINGPKIGVRDCTSPGQ